MISGCAASGKVGGKAGTEPCSLHTLSSLLELSAGEANNQNVSPSDGTTDLTGLLPEVEGPALWSSGEVILLTVTVRSGWSAANSQRAVPQEVRRSPWSSKAALSVCILRDDPLQCFRTRETSEQLAW